MMLVLISLKLKVRLSGNLAQTFNMKYDFQQTSRRWLGLALSLCFYISMNFICQITADMKTQQPNNKVQINEQNVIHFVSLKRTHFIFVVGANSDTFWLTGYADIQLLGLHICIISQIPWAEGRGAVGNWRCRQAALLAPGEVGAIRAPILVGVGRVRYQTISGSQDDPFRYLSISVPQETRCRVRDRHQYRFDTTSSVPPGPLRYQILL